MTHANSCRHSKHLLTRTGHGDPENSELYSPGATHEDMLDEPRVTHRQGRPRSRAEQPLPWVWVSGTGRTSVIAFPLY